MILVLDLDSIIQKALGEILNPPLLTFFLPCLKTTTLEIIAPLHHLLATSTFKEENIKLSINEGLPFRSFKFFKVQCFTDQSKVLCAVLPGKRDLAGGDEAGLFDVDNLRRLPRT